MYGPHSLSIATLSLGCAEHHSLVDKLHAAREAGYDGIECELLFLQRIRS